MADSGFEREYFERRRTYAGGWLGGRAPLQTRRLLSYIRRRQRGGRLLEIGSGMGEFARRAAKHFHVVATDVSQFGLTSGPRKRAPALRRARASAAMLPFHDASFDVVAAFDVLEHIADAPSALREISRVLKPRALLLMKTPNTASKGREWKGAQWLGYRDPTHVSLLARREWTAAVEDAGLGVVDTFGDGLFDSPYFAGVPTIAQHLVFKVPMIVLFGAGVRFPLRMSENIIIAARKRPAAMAGR